MSAVNATDPSIALIDRLFLISSKAHQALDFSTAYSLASMATFSRIRVKQFRSLRSRTYLHPEFQMLLLLLNAVHLYFSKSCWEFYGGKGWKEEVPGRPHWDIGVGYLHSDWRRLWSFAPVPFCLPHAASKTKKAGAAHEIVIVLQQYAYSTNAKQPNTLFSLTSYSYSYSY